jgi:hypothetical protein
MAGETGEGGGGHIMKAFLKRRWVLLSCAIVLLSCSMIDLTVVSYGTLYGYKGRPFDVLAHSFGISEGCFLYFHDEGNFQTLSEHALLRQKTERRVHTARVGKLPVCKRKAGNRKGGRTEVSIPLWLPLSAVLGWIVFQELRWREKRAKSASLAT